MSFPFGKAPTAILALAIVSGIIVVAMDVFRHESDPPDLTMTVFSGEHFRAYLKALPKFEKQHGVKVQLRRTDSRALQSRLQAAMQAGIDDVPDLVEIERDSIGFWLRGRLEDMKFVDLTDRIAEEGLDKSMVASRFTMWSKDGRKFGLPHDVHPVGLIYRRDLIEQWGIDVSQIETWDDFIEMAKLIPKYKDDKDKVRDHYALQMDIQNGQILELLMLQKGIDIFDKEGNPKFAGEETVDLIEWYITNSFGADSIGYATGGVRRGQDLVKSLQEGLVLFFFAADWFTKKLTYDAPSMHGKLAIMPLPAWEKGGRRTSVQGGTGLFITKHCENRGKLDLAWELAKYLYTNEESLTELFVDSNILPPFKDIWDHPAYQQPNPYYSNQKLGAFLVALAPQTPPNHLNAFYAGAKTQIQGVLANAALYYSNRGQAGFRDYIRDQLKRQTELLQREIDHNVFLKRPPPES